MSSRKAPPFLKDTDNLAAPASPTTLPPRSSLRNVEVWRSSASAR
eukprot:CAMPEP_0115543338 /NCGR_PEP_ID=MMETSP0271-20121206/91501_1 /TAXON_ID=71861 /ORGANISM="Scrippsiella trochoidea, Strain CCMP3099" /LENGTH=44 /DNA_ID= /DNA_START= /DNA_END= /DNA_ORIENTATION=